ncbi:aminopeptidase N [Shewanella sp. JNE10-2]|uniref:Aminopeptidase N n=1 Tax=Shewanella putrefaciens (strain 200) TaxID=399804 RepID=E6XN81_SHEP2|nr:MULTISPECIES: aminopeptidase N [unclassified Shewanella]MCK7629487.1 aminopeptidase N [Shewanella sp. JNE9-1]MCK7644657.1 aminopeptidase N [Shewanella sp. JNE3-1]MCK7652790.1 aminopeptidase N [Shewanella sp. JNE4-1]UPO26499.1 aminopeptidase N [Shewanella sp. JNE10-2]UPO33696.1 aminopeptidase N [Shewanella sp. JNE7]
MTQAQAKYLKDYQAPLFTIDTIDLVFDLAGKNTRVKATSTVKRTSSHTHPLTLDGDDLVLESVTINGEAVPYQVGAGYLTLETTLDEFELAIVTKLDPEANLSLEGLYMSDGAYCTQCEAEGFRRITYFLDRPDVLAKYTVRIEADSAAFPFLLSNGNLIDQGPLEGGRHYVCWQDPFPKPAYLFALVAGDFDMLEDEFITRSHRKVILQVFVDKGNLHKANHAMASLKKSMAWDESRFDLEYDLNIYMIVAVDFFNMGAMENKGLNIFNTKYVLADTLTATDEDYHGIESVVGHEYFHNWTGNRVTCRDWFQLSLKEGLTVFRDQEFSSDLGSRAVNRIHAIKVIKNQQFAEDSGPMSHPIRPESVIEMNNFYTVTVYNKGAEVIRMMHTLLGETQFQAGMKLYFKRHDGQAVTCDDFVAAMEDASGVDLTQFRLWYSQAGTPIVTVTDCFDASSGTYQLSLKQTLAGCKSPLHIPFSIELLDTKGVSLVNEVLDFKEAEQVFSFEGLSHKPVVSLLQDFSAPVKLHYNFSVEHLVHLMRFASSDVARWEASVTLVSQAIWQNVTHLQQQQAMTLDERVRDSFKGVLLDTVLDQALIAEILAIPSASALIEQVETVDLDALVCAREFVLTELASYCEDELVALYRSLLTVESTQARALKNQCLNWMSRVSVGAEDFVISQFENATNMTDSLGALMAANVGDLPCRSELMATFEQRWRDTPLVMDKWFMLQATRNADDVIDSLRQLQQHSSFSMSNPNRVRSLIGSFAAGNIDQFHRADGKGYAFLTECLITLNQLNPQVAARMVTPLIQFSKFDLARQMHIKACLAQLLALPDLSKDMYEKVSKALAN